MHKLFCGIDGGGTVTKVVVADVEGNVVHSFTTGSINHYAIGLQKAAEVYQEIARMLKSQLGCLPDAIFIGCSALENREPDASAQSITGGAFEHSKLILHSDVFVALLGFTGGSPGAILISGTGSMACGIDEHQQYHTVGGWGHVLGDEGSGYHLALSGIQAAIRGHDETSPPTTLTNHMLRFFELGQLSDMIDLTYNPPVEKSRIAAFAIEVEKAALEGDTIAQELLNLEIEWLARQGIAISKKCGTAKLGYYGSMITKSLVIRQRLSVLLAEKDIGLELPRLKPEAGAVVGAYQLEGVEITPQITNNLAHY